MRSPLVALSIGCAALSPRAALGKVPVFVYRPPPTATPTSSPSYSLQPSLQPTMPPVTISTPASDISTTSSELAVAKSPYGFVWIVFLVLILLSFVGAMYKLDKKKKLKQKTSPNGEGSAEGATATSTEGDNDGGLTGRLSSLWPNNQFWPKEEVEADDEANKKANKEAGRMTLQV